MAVHPKHPGLEVAVTVHDSPLEEYDNDDENSSPNEITKYIEAKSGAQFAVTVRFKRPFPTQHDVMMRLAIDGRSMAAYYCLGKELYDKVIDRHVTQWQKNGKWVKQKFCFAELNIVEETRGPLPNVVALRNVLNDKGCITLSLQLIKIGEPLVADRKSPGLKKLQEIPEKALKGDALSHQAVLSEPQKLQSKLTIRSCRPRDKNPVAIFHFKYRSLASLKALRLIPGDETIPVPLEERPEAELNPEELRELVRRLRQREPESNLVKQETATKPRIKGESFTNDNGDGEVAMLESRPCKRRRVDPEVIVID